MHFVFKILYKICNLICLTFGSFSLKSVRVRFVIFSARLDHGFFDPKSLWLARLTALFIMPLSCINIIFSNSNHITGICGHVQCTSFITSGYHHISLCNLPFSTPKEYGMTTIIKLSNRNQVILKLRNMPNFL